MISKALSESPKNLDALFSLLEKNGYEIKNRNGKNPSFRKPGNGQERFMRLDSLGENYTPESLSAVIAGTKEFVPVRWKESEAGNLLIDIQEKMREGKGAGYEKWATTYNLKQMAQTLLFLQDRKLVSFAALDARIEEVTTRTDEILEKSKAAHKRMDEIKELREQIINYQKTRQVYVEY